MSDIPVKDFKLLESICQTLFDKKGFNILSLDVRGLSTLTDYFVIVEGNVEKHVQALAESLAERMIEEGKKPVHVEGKREGDWIVMDYSEVVIHLFIPDMREKYSLEQLWQNAEIIDIPIRHAVRNV